MATSSSTTKPRVLILGAGFGGLEAAATLSESVGDAIDVILIDHGDHFVFGFAKLDVMLGRTEPGVVKHSYESLRLPGVRFVSSRITSIDPAKKRVATENEEFSADYLIIALGADLDFAATPGLLEYGNEFYSVAGVERIREELPKFAGGNVIIGVSGAPFKCPPAPSEAALMLDSYFRHHDLRDKTTIKVAIPMPVPIPPSPEASTLILKRFAERGIEFVPQRHVASLSAGKAMLDDGSTLDFDLFLGVPVHRAPTVVQDAGFSSDGWIRLTQEP